MFQSPYFETAYSLACLLMKGNNSVAGNKNNQWTIPVYRQNRAGYFGAGAAHEV
jgi:hypothetical protein